MTFESAGQRARENVMNNLLRDIRFGLRTLARKPGFTFVAVITLALGIGANVSIFSVVNALLVRPFSFEELDRIVAVWEQGEAVPRNEASAGNYF